MSYSDIPKRNKTPLDKLIDSAVDCRRKLRHLEAGKKLTFKAFYKEALQLAGCDAATIEQLGQDVKEKSGTRHLQMFISKLVRVLREPNFPRCPRDPGKLLNVYGSNEAFQELTSLGFTVAQAIALAVFEVHKRFGNDAFGVIQDWPRYDVETASLRERIGTFADEMKTAVSGADLDIATDPSVLLPDERARGLARVSFRRGTGITLSDDGWPDRLIEDAESAIPAEPPKAPGAKIKPKPKRERHHLGGHQSATA